PDTRGSDSIRDRLAKHRSTPACNDCHRRIDPPGFALENFDPIGRWREKYDKQHPVDASGVLAGDRHFGGIEEFKELLLDDRQQFYQALVTKLMSFAHGRLMTAGDRPRIDAIVSAIEHDDIGLREVIHRVTQTL
ncbi:MAG TPA: hypothetical protein DDW52_30530, partial [Planctomycetaceae bacterium]|nr:hypothetical protein [Planctomycetaceae bacterium]